MEAEVFYTQTGTDVFDSSPLTAGPWSPLTQHGGPPSALLARQIERYQPRPGHRLARVTVDILTPVPVGAGGAVADHGGIAPQRQAGGAAAGDGAGGWAHGADRASLATDCGIG